MNGQQREFPLSAICLRVRETPVLKSSHPADPWKQSTPKLLAKTWFCFAFICSAFLATTALWNGKYLSGHFNEFCCKPFFIALA